MALHNADELAVVLDRADHLGPVFARHAYGMRAWVDLFSAHVAGLAATPRTRRSLADARRRQRAPHAALPRARGRATASTPTRTTCPDEGEAIYDRIPELSGADELVGYALGSLDHFAAAARRLPRRGRGRRRDGDRPVRADVDRARAELRERAGGDGAEAHGGRGARALPRSASSPRSRATRMPAEAAAPDLRRPAARAARLAPRARGASRRCAPPRGRARCVSDGLRIGYRARLRVRAVHGPRLRRPRRRAARRSAARSTAACSRRRTCVAFRDIRALAEQAMPRRARGRRRRRARRRRPRRRPGAVPAERRRRRTPARGPCCATSRRPRSTGARRPRERSASADRATFVRADAFDRAALAALAPTPDVVLELGLYGIYHDDALIERHFPTSPSSSRRGQIVFNVQTRNPEIEYIARVWLNAAGERCVWRLRPVEQILGYAAAAGYTPASITADRFGIYRVVRLVRAEAGAMTNVLTWAADPAARRRARRLRAPARARSAATTRCGTTSPTATRSRSSASTPTTLYPERHDAAVRPTGPTSAG